jgi:TolB-like protein/tetratricopeptide (TPR) repeat protein
VAVGGSFRVGSWQVEPSLNTVSRNGASVHLEPKVIQVLICLAERAGEPVTKEELFQTVWPNTFVSEDVLKRSISELRRVFEDDSREPRVIETIPKRGYRLLAAVERPKPGRIESLAVLPLENLSRDPEQDYFADGLTEALITSLAKISALRVVSRTTAMQYKGVRNKSARGIARELGVDAVVEGTVQRSGERVRISAQLIHATTDTHLWAESYDRDLRDVLPLQTEVTQAIVREIQIRITPQEQAKLARVHPVDPEAYEAYLKGRYHWNKRNGPGIRKSTEYFQQAIEKDPTYAAAYAGLADSAGSSGWWALVTPEQGCGRAKAAARKSLEIEETAEAHASLGWAIMHYDFDTLSAEEEFQRAIELNPRYPSAHQWYSHCLLYMNRWDEGLEQGALALQLDPLSLIINVTYSGRFWLIHQWDRTVEHCRKALELDPNFIGLRWMLANAYEGKEMHQEAIQERKWVVEHSGAAPPFVAELAASYAAVGQKDEAVRLLEQLHGVSQQQYVPAYWVALVHANLKDTDETFRWLDAAYCERSARLAFVKIEPRLEYLRTDPRFGDLLRRMNFPL